VIAVIIYTNSDRHFYLTLLSHLRLVRSLYRLQENLNLLVLFNIYTLFVLELVKFSVQSDICNGFLSFCVTI